MPYCNFLWDVSPIANTSILGHPKIAKRVVWKWASFSFSYTWRRDLSNAWVQRPDLYKKNYKSIKWVGCAAVWLHGLTASVEGQSDSLSMQPFIMQRLIIISCLLISHWHIAFLNVSTNSPCLPLLPPCAGEPSLHPAHSYDDGSALALNV